MYSIPRNYQFTLNGRFQDISIIQKELELIALKYNMVLKHEDLGVDNSNPDITIDWKEVE